MGLYILIGNIWMLVLGIIVNYIYEKEAKINERVMKNMLNNSIFSQKEEKEVFKDSYLYKGQYTAANFFKRLDVRKNIAQKDNNDLRENISKLIPEEILTDIGKDVSELIDVGMSVQKKLHVMFIDISGFTHISESISPDKALGLLNVYFNGIVDISKSNGGYVDKFLGDGIMLAFEQEKSDYAIKTAIEIRQLIHKINLAGIYESINIGVGINSGIATLGTIGSKSRMDVTIIGDCVNVASRLESMTREEDHWIIIGQETHANLSDEHGFNISDIGEVSLKGREGRLCVYGVGG